MGRLLRLTLLAPDIQEAILEGRQPKGMQLEELTRAMPGAWVGLWGEQRKLSSVIFCVNTAADGAGR